jgi:hypothetical protein
MIFGLWPETDLPRRHHRRVAAGLDPAGGVAEGRRDLVSCAISWMSSGTVALSGHVIMKP